MNEGRILSFANRGTTVEFHSYHQISLHEQVQTNGDRLPDRRLE